MAGLFDEFETPVEEIPTGFGLPNGTYEVIVTDIKKHKHNDVPYVIVDLTVNEGKLAGRKHSQWLQVPQQSNTKLDKNKNPVRFTHASVLKGWLLDLGVPEDRVSTFNPDDEDDKDGIVGNGGILLLKAQKDNPQYQNAKFKLDEDVEPSGAYEGGIDDVADANTAEVDFSKFA